MTIDKSINGLIEEKMLSKVKRDDSNQHIQHLYFNHEHIVNSLLDDFEFFKCVYFRLIDKTSKIFKYNKQMRSQNSEWYFIILKRLDILLIPYKHFPEEKDKNIRYSKFAIVYGNMKEIHAKLHEHITPIITNPFDQASNRDSLTSSLYDVGGPLDSERIKEFLDYYNKCKLNAFAEPVLDILWKISYPVLPNIDPLYAVMDKESLKDWRNIISREEYEPKTTQAQDLGIRVIK